MPLLDERVSLLQLSAAAWFFRYLPPAVSRLHALPRGRRYRAEQAILLQKDSREKKGPLEVSAR